MKIEPQGSGDTARITVKWQPQTKAATGITSHRVDVGVFVGNGVTWSAPAFVCFAMPASEMRFYDAEGRLQEICYDAGNPDLGLPAETDLRWLALGRKLGSDGTAKGSRLLTEALGKEGANAFQSLASDLAPSQEAWRKLSVGADKAAAEDAQKKLQESLKSKLTEGENPWPGGWSWQCPKWRTGWISGPAYAGVAGAHWRFLQSGGQGGHQGRPAAPRGLRDPPRE
ncbi:hypothetical protein [Verrucomicrobium spinosum]|uniref:hypothetical protein n=1 Tax=Verrucomicrobium spinosum TaxID=2736 RepID=UPI00094671FC|nr:hypothetical protein [Verrucomicrobium spinosum]